MALTYPALKQEIDTNQTNITDATTGETLQVMAAAGNAQGIADALNLPRASITVRRTDVSGSDLQEAIDLADLQPTANALNNPLAAAYLQTVLLAPRNRLITDAGANTRIKANLDALVRNTQGSQTRLNAVANKNPASRAEQLFGQGTNVSHSDVSNALASG